jgi:hypothetical protein
MEDCLLQNFHDWSWSDLPEQGLEVAVGEDWNVVLIIASVGRS